MAEKDNIVLIGMPGAGKSTLGIVLAKILNYDFIDADLVIQNSCDKRRSVYLGFLPGSFSTLLVFPWKTTEKSCFCP